MTNAKDAMIRTINTILLTALVGIFSIGSTMLLSSTRDINAKLDEMIRKSQRNASLIEFHNKETILINARISALEQAKTNYMTLEAGREEVKQMKYWVQNYHKRN